MATAQQVGEMLAIMKMQMEQNASQMEQLTRLCTDKMAGQQSADVAQGSSESRITVPFASTLKKPDPPKIEAGSSEFEWSRFVNAWNRYKRRVNLLNEVDVVLELRECVSEEVDKLLFQQDTDVDLERTSEQQLLAHIKKAAVKTIHKEVHRMNFARLRQDDGEPVRQFVGRLREQAALCDFSKQCGQTCCDTLADSYAEDMISHQLIIGLRNQEFLSRLLAELSSLETLEKKLLRLESLESSEQCTQSLSSSSAEISKAAPIRRSEHKKKKRDALTNDYRNDCKGCGRKSHGQGKTMSAQDCPAHNRTCLICNAMGHFRVVCPKMTNRSNANKAAEDIQTSDGEGESNPAATLASASVFF